MKSPNGMNSDSLLSKVTARDFLAILFRQRRILMVSFAAIFGGVVLFALFLAARYTAQAQILVAQDERADPVVTGQPNAQPVVNHNGVPIEEMNSEVQLLLSRDLLEKVVTACGLDMRPSLTDRLFPFRQLTREQRIDKAVRKLADKLDIQVEKMSNVITISYPSPDPQLAADVVRTLTDAYLKKHAVVHRPPGTVDFFQQETEQYRQGLQQAENQLVKFTQAGGVVAAQLETEATLQKLTEFEAMHAQTQAAIAEDRERIRKLEAQQAAMTPRLTTQVRVSDNAQLLQQLNGTLLTLELKRTELLEKFTPDYRPVKEVETEIAQTRDAIAAAEKAQWREETTDRDPNFELVREELTKTSADLAGMQAREVALGRAQRAYQEKAEWLKQQGMTQQDLVRTAKTNEDNYLLYLHKQEEARIADALDNRRIMNVSVAEAASVPVLPDHSDLWYMVVAGMLASLGSVGLAFGSDSLDPTLRTPDEVESILNIPVLASMPKGGNGNGSHNGNGNHNGHGKHNGNGRHNGRAPIHVP